MSQPDRNKFYSDILGDDGYLYYTILNAISGYQQATQTTTATALNKALDCIHEMRKAYRDTLTS